jgi:hypothetical protein
MLAPSGGSSFIPIIKGQGIGSMLLKRIESMFAGVSRYELFTGSRSEGNLRLYQRHGYVIVRVRDVSPSLSIAFLEKAGGMSWGSFVP